MCLSKADWFRQLVVANLFRTPTPTPGHKASTEDRWESRVIRGRKKDEEGELKSGKRGGSGRGRVRLLSSFYPWAWPGTCLSSLGYLGGE